MALVHGGDTTVDELRRVAAAPVRVVTEPSPVSPPDHFRIGWLVGTSDERTPALYHELVAAAAVLGSQVQVVCTVPESPALHALDALVVDAPLASASLPRHALVVALAAGEKAWEQAGAPDRDADLVLSNETHGRFLLATILALLRWRSGG